MPLPHSGIALALGPIPPISRSAGPSQFGLALPAQSQAGEGGRLRRKGGSQQPTLGGDGGAFAGPRSGAAGPEGAKAG